MIKSKLKLTGFGRYRPEYSQDSTELDIIFKEPLGHTYNKFAIKSRPIASPKETSSFMAIKACEEALSGANWQPNDIDLIIGGCGVMEQPIPSTSVLVQSGLGMERSGIECFDVNMTCLSFLKGLEVAAMAINSGKAKRILLFSADIASAGLDYDSPHASAIFGDGAAAVCIEGHEDENGPALLSSVFKTYSIGKDTAHIKSGGTRIRVQDDLEVFKAGAKFFMDPVGIFRAASRVLPLILRDTLDFAGVEMNNIDNFICHQASAPALEHMRNTIKTRPERVIDIFEDTGNQIAASLPNALYAAHKMGRLTPNSHALLLGTSAGISIGAMVLKI